MTTGIPRHQRAEEPQDRRGLIGCGHRPLCLLAQLDCLGDQLDVGRFAAAAVERKSEVNMPAAVKREPSDFGFDDVTADGRHGPRQVTRPRITRLASRAVAVVGSPKRGAESAIT